MISESRYTNELRKLGLIEASERSLLNIKVFVPLVKKGGTGTNKLTEMAKNALAGKNGLNLTGYQDYRNVEVVGAWRWNKNNRFRQLERLLNYFRGRIGPVILGEWFFAGSLKNAKRHT